ncbi:hypothetical protein Ancab_004235 [Ancistrocladus abbreviatus]
MKWNKDYLDLILVSSGLLILFGYHLYLLYKCITTPEETVIGFENHSRRAWVRNMMKVDVANRSAAFSVISSYITAATFMASTSLALTSLIGTWVGSSSSNQSLISQFIYGDTRASINTIKYISVLAFFLLAFGAFIQSARYHVNANFLMSMPQADVPVDYVEGAVIMGSYFWQVGLRAVYFASSLLLWVFGPIPMFVSCLGAVMLLHILDTNKNPLHDFEQITGKKLFQKTGEEEIIAVVAGTEHPDRPHRKDS